MSLKSFFLKTTFISGLIGILGSSANSLVEFLNGQFMPVYDKDCPAGKVIDFVHRCGSPSTHAKFLSDFIHVPIAETIYSPGDVLIISAKVIFIPALMLYLYCILKED